MHIERITVGRVRSIPGEYGNRRMEMSAVLNPDEDAQAAARRLAGDIDRELIAAEEQEQAIATEERERAQQALKLERERRKLEAARLQLSPTVKLHWRDEHEWVVVQDLPHATMVLTLAGTWEPWHTYSRARLAEVVFPTEDDARAAYAAHPATEPAPEPDEEDEVHDIFTDM